MTKNRKTAREKLEKKLERRVVDTPKGKMLVPTPIDVLAQVLLIPRGKLATVNQIRDKLAREHQADYTCPLVTGIFLRIIAETAEEDSEKGVKEIAPYWRVVKADGGLNEKFPGGTEIHASYLREEGYDIEINNRKKLPRVKNFENHLQAM